MRTAYEWETKTDNNAMFRNIERTKKEIKRISETTLRGNFSNPEDRKYWVEKLNRLNRELIALEEIAYEKIKK